MIVTKGIAASRQSLFHYFASDDRSRRIEQKNMTGTMKVSVKNILVALSAAFFVLSGAFQTPAAEQPMPALDTEGTCAIQPLHVSVHDPSVILDQDGTCYLFGSHWMRSLLDAMAVWDPNR